MKLCELKLRLIAPLVVLCALVLVLGTAPAALSQVPRGTTVSITGSSFTTPNTMYFYSLTSGPDLATNESISITGMGHPGNNGTFTITAVSPGTSFTVVNSNGATASESGTAATATSPESGALLEIDGTVGASPTGHIKVYDSQIHTGNIVTVTGALSTNGSNCNVADLIPTDAYLLQAAAPNGCDDGDVAESALTFVGNTNTLNSGSFNFIPPFNISTQYVCLRNNTTVSITAASQNGGTTTYTYTFTGTPLQVGETLIISGMSDAANNGPVVISNLVTTQTDFGPVTTFDVISHPGVTASGQNGMATPGACSDTFTNITAASKSGANTIYTYAVTFGPPLTTTLLPNGETVKITCFTDTLVGNNGTFTIPSTAPLTSTMFTAANASGVSTTQTMINNITAATNNGDGTTTFTYSGGTSGPALQSPLASCPAEPVTTSGMTDLANNGTFKITALGSGAFTVANAGGVTTGTTISITAATNNGDGTTTYTYSVTSGPALESGETVAITGMSDGGNNGTFTINPTPTSTMFTVAHSGTTTTTPQGGTGTVTQNGAGTATQIGAGTAAMSNTNATVFSNDTGFLTVTNTSGSAFAGTIKLSGNSSSCGFPSDTVTGLAAGASAVLALSNDSSSCGGFNGPQTQTLVAGQTNVFPIGKDFYQITPFNSNSGDTLTLLPVPVPAGPVASSTFGPFSAGFVNPTIGSGFGWQVAGQFGQVTPAASPLRFSATGFPNQACVPIADFSSSARSTASPANPFGGATLNPVCPMIQLTCLHPVIDGAPVPCSDENTFFYTGQLGFTADPIVGTGVGGVHFLGQHLVPCVTTGFNLDTAYSYTGSAPGVDYPTKIGGSGNSCFVSTYDPNVAPVAINATSSLFAGFQNPVINCPTAIPPATPPPCVPQPIQAGSTIPFIWQSFVSQGVPLTGLTLCANSIGTNCTAPWVFIELAPIPCPNTTTGTTLDDIAAGSSALQTLSPPGTYQFNWKTSKTANPAGSCATPILGFSTGLWAINVAQFRFK